MDSLCESMQKVHINAVPGSCDQNHSTLEDPDHQFQQQVDAGKLLENISPDHAILSDDQLRIEANGGNLSYMNIECGDPQFQASGFNSATVSSTQDEQEDLETAFSNFITGSMDYERSECPYSSSPTEDTSLSHGSQESLSDPLNSSGSDASAFPINAFSLNPSYNKRRSQNFRYKTRDPTWLKVEICRDFQRGECSRALGECRFAHPTPNCIIENGKVTTCFDSLKFRCTRVKCKYYHPPEHIQLQIKLIGKSYQLLRHEKEYNGYMTQYSNQQCMQYPYNIWLYPYFLYNSFLYSNYSQMGSYPQYNPEMYKYLSNSDLMENQTLPLQPGSEKSATENNSGDVNIYSSQKWVWPEFESCYSTFAQFE